MTFRESAAKRQTGRRSRAQERRGENLKKQCISLSIKIDAAIKLSSTRFLPFPTGLMPGGEILLRILGKSAQNRAFQSG